MSRDYHSAVRARAAFVEEIRAGKHDLAAEKTAANYNKSEALKVSDMERANLFEQEIARITQQEIEIERERKADQRASSLRNHLLMLDSSLSRLSRDMSNIRHSLDFR